MNKPNMYCGECPYWLAYGEPETTDEQNEAIIEHCRHCTHPCGIVDEEYFKIINNAKMQIQFRKSIYGDI